MIQRTRTNENCDLDQTLIHPAGAENEAWESSKK